MVVPTATQSRKRGVLRARDAAAAARKPSRLPIQIRNFHPEWGNYASWPCVARGWHGIWPASFLLGANHKNEACCVLAMPLRPLASPRDCPIMRVGPASRGGAVCRPVATPSPPSPPRRFSNAGRAPPQPIHEHPTATPTLLVGLGAGGGAEVERATFGRCKFWFAWGASCAQEGTRVASFALPLSLVASLQPPPWNQWGTASLSNAHWATRGRKRESARARPTPLADRVRAFGVDSTRVH